MTRSHLAPRHLAWVLLALASSCSQQDPRGAGRAGDPPPVGVDSSDPLPERPNVVLILIDTLRADHLEAYGYERNTAPEIAAMAEEGVVFERAITAAPYTLAATASLLTGVYPTVHRAVGVRDVISPDVSTLAERLEKADYETVGIYRNENVRGDLGFDRGFDQYINPKEGPAHLVRDVALTQAALTFLEQGHEQPFFLYLHLIDPHDPYAPPATEEEIAALGPVGQAFYQQEAIRPSGALTTLQKIATGQLDLPRSAAAEVIQLYDREIGASSREVGRILDAIEENGLAESTIVFLTSDHGEELWEHGGHGHGRTHYEEVIRVPLIVTGPGIGQGRIKTPVSLIDVAPTVLRMADLEAPDEVQGIDLTDALHAPASATLPERTIFTEGGYRMELGRFPSMVRSATVGTTKFIIDTQRSRKEAYDLGADPAEERNLLMDEPSKETKLALAGILRQHRDNLESAGRVRSAVVDLNEEDLRNLQALGYLGGEEDILEARGDRQPLDWLSQPIDVPPMDEFGLLGHEVFVDDYSSSIEFDGGAWSSEQLLYGWGVEPGKRALMMDHAGVRLARSSSHTGWRMTGRVFLRESAPQTIELEVYADGLLQSTHELRASRDFVLEGDLPRKRRASLRLDFMWHAESVQPRRRGKHIPLHSFRSLQRCLIVDRVEMTVD